MGEDGEKRTNQDEYCSSMLRNVILSPISYKKVKTYMIQLTIF